MSISDLLTIIQWWGMLFLLTLVFLPLGLTLFSQFFDKGYIFVKSLSIALFSYLVFFLGILHIVPFTFPSMIVLLLVLTGSMYYFNRKHLQPPLLKSLFPIILLEEALFFALMFFWVYIRGYNPEIHGLEKYMDFGFMNSILRSEYFPPKDMWLTPFSINYYYFGHLTTAVLTRLSGIPSNITYNLMLGTIVGLCFTSSFSIGGNLLSLLSTHTKFSKVKILCAGLLTAFLVTFAGNLHTVYTLFTPYENEKPVPPVSLDFTPTTFPNSYWYPNATRFIYNTIHEFPIYSWVVADLHGHVLDIPFVLLIIGLLLSLYHYYAQNPPRKYSNKILSTLQSYTPLDLPVHALLGVLIASMYMTNAWDGLIYLLLVGFIFLLISLQHQLNKKDSLVTSVTNSLLPTIFSSGLVFAFFVLFSLPFSLQFKPFVSGVGILCAPDMLVQLKALGPFMFEADHCQKSPLWQLLILYGFFLFFTLSFLLFITKEKKLSHSDTFVLGLIILSFLLILIPEFIYVKDIYPAHYRANTMFKLVFQAFIMLSLVSGFVVVRILSHSKKFFATLLGTLSFVSFFLFSIIVITGVFVYPFLATKAYYNNLQNFGSIDGTKYLETLHPDDYKAITWINNNVKGQPVILEAQGDSYTDYGRISTNTGLPTVLGWTVHEWLWRGKYDLDEGEKSKVTPQDILEVPAPRITEITTLYESPDRKAVEDLINKYNIEYVYIGNLERQKYPKLTETIFEQIGSVVYQTTNTKIYKL